MCEKDPRAIDVYNINIHVHLCHFIPVHIFVYIFRSNIVE